MRSLRIIVAGCGRLGAHLASVLSRAGHHVVVIDRDTAAFEALPPGTFGGREVEGDATEPSVLRRAGLEDADLLIAAIRDDNANGTVAMLARTLFGVDQVLARVSDPERETMYRDLGVMTVCATALGGEAILDLVTGDREAGGGAR